MESEVKKVESRLIKIIQRLQAMTSVRGTAPQIREFTQFGVYVCEVSYQPTRQEFIVRRVRQQEQLVFDDLDLAAMEVYDCLYDFRHTF